MKDGIGFIEILDIFGDDVTVVNAARVSFAKEVTEIKEGDKKLIRFLARHNHISPFFHPQVRFRIKMPIFVAREWYRHTIGFSRNEVSRRYVDSAPEVWIPANEDLRSKDKNKKQGSRLETIMNAETVLKDIEKFMEVSLNLYDSLLLSQVAPEIARCVLPQSMYTEFIETGSLAAYARLVGLRMDPGAQIEIRRYAEAVSFLLAKAFPESWAALEDARRGDGVQWKEEKGGAEVVRKDEAGNEVRYVKLTAAGAGAGAPAALERNSLEYDFVTNYWGT